MYGNAPFDGSAAFSGGGFMPSQVTQTSDTSFTPAKSREAQSLLPLTVKQISEAFLASDDKTNFLIDGVDVNNVKLVGLLFYKTETVTDVAFVLDDGTGRMNCHRWINEPLDSKEMDPLSDGMYVKVHGHLKGFQGKKQLMVYFVKRVTDYNEIANHFAECMYVHCHNTKTRKRQDAPQVTGQMPNSAVNTPSKGYQPTSSNHVSVQYNNDGVKGIDKLILDYLQQPSCVKLNCTTFLWSRGPLEFIWGRTKRSQVKGIHRAEIAQQLHVPEHKILEAIEVLESEGLVYSTIDDFHFRSTTNG